MNCFDPTLSAWTIKHLSYSSRNSHSRSWYYGTKQHSWKTTIINKKIPSRKEGSKQTAWNAVNGNLLFLLLLSHRCYQRSSLFWSSGPNRFHDRRAAFPYGSPTFPKLSPAAVVVPVQTQPPHLNKCTASGNSRTEANPKRTHSYAKHCTLAIVLLVYHGWPNEHESAIS